ncbi:MAG: DinB family protein [Pyrinomonadaceae bacterium]
MDELSTVRVVKLNIPDRHFDGTEGVKRRPKIGDTGTIVHRAGELCIVESVDAAGLTVWLADFALDELEDGYGRKVMDERITSIVADMNTVAEDARATFGTLNDDQLNWKPGEKSWSVGQCLDHLIKTNEQFYPEFAKLASGNRKNSFIENYSPLTGWAGRFLINAVSEDSKKAKAPSKAIVPPSDIGAGIVDAFCEHISEVNKKIEAVAVADRKKTVVTSPFLAVFTYTLDDAYTVLVEHSKRHIRQAKRVMEAEGFPSTAESANA